MKNRKPLRIAGKWLMAKAPNLKTHMHTIPQSVNTKVQAVQHSTAGKPLEVD